MWARIENPRYQVNNTKTMKTFITDIFPRIQRFSKKLDNLSLLTNQHWVSIDNILDNKTVYIFRHNNELLISTNGKIEKAKWEYIGNKSLLIDKSSESYLFKHGFFDENILALKVDSSDEYAIFVNENKYDGELNSINKVVNFLEGQYLDTNIETTMRYKFEDKEDNSHSLKLLKNEDDLKHVFLSSLGETIATIVIVIILVLILTNL